MLLIQAVNYVKALVGYTLEIMTGKFYGIKLFYARPKAAWRRVFIGAVYNLSWIVKRVRKRKIWSEMPPRAGSR